MNFIKFLTLSLCFLTLIITSFLVNLNTGFLISGKTSILGDFYGSTVTEELSDVDIDDLYDEIGLDAIVGKEVFKYSLTGYSNLVKSDLIKNKAILTIIDYTRPSTEKRLHVIDLYAKKILLNSLVAHGKNTGGKYARYFSNETGSLQSSLGFFITKGTYFGENGYSLRLKGLENNYNNNAEERYIVIHGARYVSEQFIKDNGAIGRSWGCPAVPVEISESLINVIKDGSPVFIYHNNLDYINGSKFLNTKTASRLERSRYSLL